MQDKVKYACPNEECHHAFPTTWQRRNHLREECDPRVEIPQVGESIFLYRAHEFSSELGEVLEVLRW